VQSARRNIENCYIMNAIFANPVPALDRAVAIQNVIVAIGVADNQLLLPKSTGRHRVNSM
jgi:hypothetical protein